MSRPTVSQAALYVRDLAERVIATFLTAFLGTLVAGGWFDIARIRDLSAVQAAALSGIAAVLSLVKGLVAKWVSNRDSASLAPGV